MKKLLIIFLLFIIQQMYGITNGPTLSVRTSNVIVDTLHRTTFRVFEGHFASSYNNLGIRITINTPGVRLDTVFVSKSNTPYKTWIPQDADANGFYLLDSYVGNNTPYDVTFDFTVDQDVDTVLVKVDLGTVNSTFMYGAIKREGALYFNIKTPEECVAVFSGQEIHKQDGKYKFDILFSGVNNCPGGSSYSLSFYNPELRLDSTLISGVKQNYNPLFEAEYKEPFDYVISLYLTPLIVKEEFSFSPSIVSRTGKFQYGETAIRLMDNLTTDVSSEQSKGVRVSPNPLAAFDDVHVYLKENASYELMNQQGSVVQRGLLEAGDNVLRICQSGLYMLQIGDQKAIRVVVD